MTATPLPQSYPTPTNDACYTSPVAKKITLETLAAQLSKMDARIESGFAAVAEDISKLATKEQLVALHGQVNSIEAQLRDMKHTKLHARVADLEEEVFGETRS
jgi:hypothetical protein